MGRVVVVGSINDDLVVTADRLPGPGETVAGSSVAHWSGGKGANQAVAAARAGAATAMVGCVGRDDVGDRLRDGLAAAGVDVSAVAAVDEPTGVAVVTVSGGENTIVVVSGANALVEDTGLALEPDDVVVAQLETPIATTTEVFHRARAVGATTILNPAPAMPLPTELLALVDHLVVNEHEMELATGVTDADLVLDQARLRARLGAITVHLTQGAEGLIVMAPDGFLFVAGREVDVVDSTGAGDCYVGTVAACLATGVDLDSAVGRANAAAALSVTRPGAARSMPTAAEVDAFLAGA